MAHEERKHALLSVSGASRWLNCTPSARLEEPFENTSSTAAEEGTLAHELAELTLRKAIGTIGQKFYDFEFEKIKNNEIFSEEMPEEVDKYVAYVLEQYTASQLVTKDAVILIEDKIDLRFLIEDGFGTCDTEIIADQVLEVIDLKYGKGIKVSAIDNSQLKLYALGAYKQNSLLYDIKTVKLTIVQPRLDNIASWEISAEELEAWGEEVVKPRAVLATQGGGEQKTGEWCKWCRAKAKCAKMAEECLKQAETDFSDPKLLSDADILFCYESLDKIANWAKAVKEYVEKEAINNGKVWEGYKVVEGKSNRKWKDEDLVKAKLEAELYDPKDYLNTKLKGLGDLEKLLKKSFDKVLGEFIEKPQGSPTLVHESDKRAAFAKATAQEDFK